MHYAINLADWTKYTEGIEGFMLRILLEPVIERQNIIYAQKDRFDEMALPLMCDEKRASAIVEIIRKKYKRHELRCYQSKTGNGGWNRI